MTDALSSAKGDQSGHFTPFSKWLGNFKEALSEADSRALIQDNITGRLPGVSVKCEQTDPPDHKI